jgi:hypothetical protein
MTKTDNPDVELTPLPGDGRLDWKAIADEVRRYPGEWCRVSRPLNPTVAQHIKRGRYPHVPPEEFETATRKHETLANKSWIYLRVPVKGKK